MSYRRRPGRSRGYSESIREKGDVEEDGEMVVVYGSGRPDRTLSESQQLTAVGMSTDHRSTWTHSLVALSQ